MHGNCMIRTITQNVAERRIRWNAKSLQEPSELLQLGFRPVAKNLHVEIPARIPKVASSDPSSLSQNINDVAFERMLAAR